MFRISRCLLRGLLAIGVVGMALGGGIVPEASGAAPAKPVSAPAPASGKPGKDGARHVDPAGAQKLLKEDPEVIVVDVRTPREFAAGHLDKARNVNFQGKDFATELGKLDRAKTYLVHCAAGGRSTQSLEVFRKLGFKSVVHLDGGMGAWTEAGLPVTK